MLGRAVVIDLEHHFISVLMRTKDLTSVREARITADYFRDEDHRRVFEFIEEHFRRYGEMPLPAHVRKNWPTYTLIRVEHGIDFYIEEMRRSYLADQLTYVLADVQDALEDRDPEKALRAIQQSVTDLSSLTARMVDVNLTETWEERLTEYEEMRENSGRLRGLPTGFASIDRATLGLQPGQFVVLVGLPKAGKSTLLLAMAKAVQEYGVKVGLIGFEMSNQEMSARYDAQAAKVDHLKLLSGRITREDVRALEREGKRREGLPDFILSADVASATTVSGIAAKIEQHKPKVLFIDGIYLMDDELGEPKGSSAAITNITRGLKRLAQTTGVCIVGTTQVLASKVSKSSGVQAASVGYSSSYSQDCDVMIAVEATEDEEIQKLKVLLSRIGPRVEVEVLWDWGCGTFEELDAADDAEAV